MFFSSLCARLPPPSIYCLPPPGMVSADPLCVASAKSFVPAHPKDLRINGLATPVLPLDKSFSAAPPRPRGREITSRYKSPTSTPSSTTTAPPAASRRSPSPRPIHVPDVASPKRAVSAERRRQSPTRIATVSNGSLDGGLVPKRIAGRSEVLWPSTRSMYASMQGESYSPPPKSVAKTRSDNRSKCASLASDQTLRPSANVVQGFMDQSKGTPERKGTPLRRQSVDQAENARPSENLRTKPEQHRWPGSSNGKYGAAMSRSVDLGADRERETNRTPSVLVQGKFALTTTRVQRSMANSRGLSQSINEGPASSALQGAVRKHDLECRARSRESPINSRRGPPSLDAVRITASPHYEHYIQPVRQSGEEEAKLASAALTDAASDANVSSPVGPGAAVATSLSTGLAGKMMTRRATVPARFLQDASGKSRTLPDIGRLQLSILEPDYSINGSGKLSGRQRSSPSSERKCAMSSPWSMSPHHFPSAFKSSQQPVSPAKVTPTSPSRRLPSPTRSRGPTVSSLASSFPANRSGGAVAMLNFGVEARKGKRALTQIEEVYLHRILHNRLLQWCFVNARAEFATNTQRLAGEKLVFSVWAKIAELRKSVTSKRIKLQQARQTQKLTSILEAQASKLEDWSSLRQEHGSALSGSVQALEAAVLRVPVNEGVRADTQAVKDAMTSAVDVVHGVESSVTNLLPKLKNTNTLMSELALVAAQERALLEECGDLLGIASTLEVEERSLRTHLLQFEQERARVLGHVYVIRNGSKRNQHQREGLRYRDLDRRIVILHGYTRFCLLLKLPPAALDY